MSEKEENKFEVRLKGFKLPEDVEKRLNSEIQQVVLREIAKMDFRGDTDFKIRFPECTDPRSPPIGRTWGIIIVGGERIFP